jgi:serine phosphatase RsbU (regulator of sigma subunit)/sugar lactone lactonase YvrE
MKSLHLLSVLVLLTAVISCNRTPKDDGTTPPPLFPQAKSMEANPKGGYTLNSVTGDTIKPLVNSLGDTVKTGIPIPAKGRIIHPDSVAKPKSFKVPPQSQLAQINAHPNKHKIPDNLTVIPVNKDSLKTISFSSSPTKGGVPAGRGGLDTSHYIINSIGDTVKTGVPIPVKGKKVKTIQPIPTKALPPAVKDAAIVNLQYLDVDQGMNSSYVWSILEDSHGNLWFGTYGGGVSKYNGESFTHFTEKEGLSYNYVRSILEDSHGNLWFGTYGGGVSKYNGESFTHFTEKEGLSNNIVLSILEDSHGNLWFGTNGGGVSKYNGESFTHFTEKEGLSYNYVRSILEDSHGNLWFGTYGGGVSKYNGESFTHFTEKEGLSNNIVWSILEDADGRVWISTEKGLNVIAFGGMARVEAQTQNVIESTKVSRKPQLIIHIFHKEDGLKGLDFFENSVFIDCKNRAWWGGGKGLEMLDLNQFKISEKIPQPVLKQLDINEQFIDYRNITDSLGNEITFNGVQRFENYPLNLELPYDKNHLTFHFVAIDWSAPHKIKYSYRMLGLNDNWSAATHETKADYRNLPYGTYTFQVRAIGESQQWSKPFEYTFTIHPPWWHTWWARTLYALVALTLILALVKWRTAALKKRQKELEQTVEERTAEVVQQKHLIEEKHKEITDSINYAERIQRSFLATREMLDQNLRDYFVFFKPKDVVSGDFYWAAELNNGNFSFCCADSTGHGVPGAIMSILNISSLEKSIEAHTEPQDILSETRRIIIDRLKKDGSPEGGKDGMDCSLLVLNKDRKQLWLASAHNSVIIIRKGEIMEYRGDKMPVGKHDKDNDPFTLHTLTLEQGDTIFTLTDGFPDQFGGPKGKKFMIKSLKELFLQIAHLPMHEQEQKLTEEFDTWKGTNEQVDDVCVIGVRI